MAPRDFSGFLDDDNGSSSAQTHTRSFDAFLDGEDTPAKSAAPAIASPDTRDLIAQPGSEATDATKWDKRADGSQKGNGFLGLLRRPDGGVSSEISIGVNFGGKEVEIPTMVPTLTRDEVDTLLKLDPNKDEIPQAIKDKAVAYARTRLDAGKSPFADASESPVADEGMGPKIKRAGEGVVGVASSMFRGTPAAGAVALARTAYDASQHEADPSKFPDKTKPEDTYAAIGQKYAENIMPLFKESLGGGLSAYGKSLEMGAVPGSESGVSPADFRGDMENLRTSGAAVAKKGREIYKAAEADLKANAPNVDPETLKGYTYATATAITQMIPSIAVGLAGGENAGLGVMGAQVFGQQYGEAEAGGMSPSQAAAEASFYSAVEVLTEKIPFHIVMKEGTAFGKRVLHALGAESIGEGVNQAIETGYEAAKLVYQKGIPFADAWKQLDGWSQVRQAMVVGGAMGGGMATMAHPFAKDQTGRELYDHIDQSEFQHTGAQAAAAAMDPNGRPISDFVPSPHLSAEDHASPIKDQDIKDGHEIVDHALGGSEADDILDAHDLPPLGSRVNLDYGDGRQAAGEIEHAGMVDMGLFGRGHEPGISIKLDNGTYVRELISHLQAAGVQISPEMAQEISQEAQAAQAAINQGPAGAPTAGQDAQGVGPVQEPGAMGSTATDATPGASTTTIPPATVLPAADSPPAGPSAGLGGATPGATGASNQGVASDNPQTIDSTDATSTPRGNVPTLPGGTDSTRQAGQSVPNLSQQGLPGGLNTGVAGPQATGGQSGGARPPAVAVTAKNHLITQVHEALTAAGVQWDNDKRFMKWTEKLTGKRHLDKMTPGQLRKVLENVDKAPKPRQAAARVKPSGEGGHDALTVLAAHGGIRDDEGHDVRTAVGQRTIPGHGTLIRKNGNTLTQAIEILHQHEFFGPVGRQGDEEPGAPIPSHSEGLAFLQRAAKGKVYRPELQAAKEAEKATRDGDESEIRARDDVKAAAKDLGLDVPDDAVTRVLEIMSEQGLDAEDALTLYLESDETDALDQSEQESGDAKDVPYDAVKPAEGDSQGRGAAQKPEGNGQDEKLAAPVDKPAEEAGSGPAVEVGGARPDGGRQDGPNADQSAGAEKAGKRPNAKSAEKFQHDEAEIAPIREAADEYEAYLRSQIEDRPTNRGDRDSEGKYNAALYAYEKKHGLAMAEDLERVLGATVKKLEKQLERITNDHTDRIEAARKSQEAPAIARAQEDARRAVEAERQRRLTATPKTMAEWVDHLLEKVKAHKGPAIMVKTYTGFARVEAGSVTRSKEHNALIAPVDGKRKRLKPGQMDKIAKALGTTRLAAIRANESGRENPATAQTRPPGEKTEPNQAPKVDESHGAKSAHIQDFGEKIEGARKDYAAKLKDAADLDVAAAPLSDSWPEPDYQKLIDGGADAWTVAFIHAARDEVPTKPKKSWKLQRWVDQVTTLRGMASRLLSGEVNRETVQKLLNESGGLRNWAGRIDLYEKVGHSQSLRGVSVSSGSYSVYKGVTYKPSKTFWTVDRKAKATAFGNWPSILAEGATREEAINNFVKQFASIEVQPAADKQVRFGVYSRSGTKGYFVGKKIGRGVVRLKEFSDLKEARAYIADHYDDLVAQLAKFKNIPNERKESNSPRVGTDHRNGADATPDQFMEAFGFRGVQFGNYVEGPRRQQDLNEAYDALMDLAGVLDIPSQALSLNGELGLAFGARGTGGKGAPAAHYEPNQIVINLTKRSGAGSLAHEWWHALDNYLARSRGEKGGYISSAPRERGAGVRPELVSAFAEVMRAIKASPMAPRAVDLDRRRSQPYWSTDIEMSARAFETFIISKLADAGQSNDFLANIVSKQYWDAAAALGLEAENTYPYLDAAEQPDVHAAFDKLFHVIETRPEGRNRVLYARPRGVSSETGSPELQAAVRSVMAGTDHAVVDRLETNAKALANILEGQSPFAQPRSLREGPSAMVAHVLAVTENPEVLRAIVSSLPVDVVNVLRSQKLTPELLLRDKPMLENVLAVDRQSPIAPNINEAVATALVRSIADTATEIANLARGPLEGSVASAASTNDSISGAHDREDARTRRGRSSRSKPRSQAAFDQWFKDSKVVDSAGKPLVVYHGTSSEIEAFETKTGLMWFTTDTDAASTYGYPEYRTVAAYLSLQNPASERDIIAAARVAGVDRETLTDEYPAKMLEMEGVLEALKGRGFDGAIVTDTDSSGANEVPAYVAFSPTQIKSTENLGTWSPTDPRIRYSQPKTDQVTVYDENGKPVIADQYVLAGAEQSAEQAKARTAAIKKLEQDRIMAEKSGSKMRPTKPQKDPGGLFGEPEKKQGSLFRVPALHEMPAAEVVDLAQRLEARLKEVGLSDKIAGRVVQKIYDEAGNPTDAEGTYALRLIEVAMSAPDGNLVIDHEIIHALRDLGVFTAKEWNMILRTARADTTRMASIRQRYPDLLPVDQIEEAAADMFADSMKLWRANETDRGPLAELWNRVRAFFRAVRAAVTGGYSDMAQLYEGIDRGYVGARKAPGSSFARTGEVRQAIAPEQAERARLAMAERYVEEHRAAAARFEASAVDLDKNIGEAQSGRRIVSLDATQQDGAVTDAQKIAEDLRTRAARETKKADDIEAFHKTPAAAEWNRKMLELADRVRDVDTDMADRLTDNAYRPPLGATTIESQERMVAGAERMAAAKTGRLPPVPYQRDWTWEGLFEDGKAAALERAGLRDRIESALDKLGHGMAAWGMTAREINPATQTKETAQYRQLFSFITGSAHTLANDLMRKDKGQASYNADRAAKRMAELEEHLQTAEALPAPRSGQKYARKRGTVDQEKAINKAIDAPKDGGIVTAIKDAYETIRRADTDEMTWAVADELAGLRTMGKELDPQAVDRDFGAYVAARNTRHLAGQIEAMLKYAAPVWDANDQTLKPKPGSRGFYEIVRPLYEKGIDRLFDGYAYARRVSTQGLINQNREQNLTRLEVQDLLSLGTQHPEFVRIFNEIQAYKKAVLDAAQAMGLVNAQQRATWEQADHVPFYRSVEGDTKQSKGGPNRKRGLSGQSAQIRRLTGGDERFVVVETATGDIKGRYEKKSEARIEARKLGAGFAVEKAGQPIIGVVENIAKNFTHLVDASMKNHASVMAIDEAVQLGWARKVKMEQTQALVPMQVMARALTKAGISVTGGPAQGVAAVAAIQSPVHPGNNIIQIRRAGVVEYYEVDDKVTYKALEGIHSLTGNSKLMKVLTVPKTLLTRSATATPYFMLRNIIRDSFNAWLISEERNKSLFREIGKTMKASLARLDDPRVISIMMAGGDTGWYQNAPADVVKQLRRLETSGRAKILTLANPAEWWHLWHRIGRASELANRLATFDAVKQQTGSTRKAAYSAADLMDFQLKGGDAVIQFFTAIIPFMNARIQGIYKLGRVGTTKNKRARNSFVSKAGAMVAFSLLLAVLNATDDDDDGYNDLSETIKDGSWVIPLHRLLGIKSKGRNKDHTIYHTGYISDADHGIPRFLLIPKPFELGALFGTVPERIVQGIAGNDRMKDEWNALVRMVGSTLAMNPAGNPVTLELMEQAFNYDTYTGRPIESSALTRLAPEDRYTANTSQTARAIGEHLPDWMGDAKSPARIEHFIRGFTADIGTYFLAATDAVARSMGASPVAPTARTDDILHSFVLEDPARGTKWADRFYEIRDQAEQAANSVNARLKEGKSESATRLANANMKVLRRVEHPDGHISAAPNKAIEKTADDLSELRKQERLVRDSHTLTSEQKRLQLDRITASKNRLAKGAAKWFEGRKP